jgi:TRAP-type C4-dicarboxylate transport system permease small subunit
MAGFKIRKIKLGKIKRFFKKLPRILAERAFLTFLGLLLIASILGAAIFYQYYISVQIPPEISKEEDILKFETATYQNILNEWKERNEKVSQLNQKEYPDPFEGEEE